MNRPDTTRPPLEDRSVGAEEACELTLFVSGATALSSRAISLARDLCETHLAGRYVLSVVDVHEHSTTGLHDDVVATPTLVRTRPQPPRRYVGDLSQTGRVLSALLLVDPAPAIGSVAS